MREDRSAIVRVKSEAYSSCCWLGRLRVGNNPPPSGTKLVYPASCTRCMEPGEQMKSLPCYYCARIRAKEPNVATPASFFAIRRTMWCGFGTTLDMQYCMLNALQRVEASIFVFPLRLCWRLSLICYKFASIIEPNWPSVVHGMFPSTKGP